MRTQDSPRPGAFVVNYFWVLKYAIEQLGHTLNIIYIVFKSLFSVYPCISSNYEAVLNLYIVYLLEFLFIDDFTGRFKGYE